MYIKISNIEARRAETWARPEARPPDVVEEAAPQEPPTRRYKVDPGKDPPSYPSNVLGRDLITKILKRRRRILVTGSPLATTPASRVSATWGRRDTGAG